MVQLEDGVLVVDILADVMDISRAVARRYIAQGGVLIDGFRTTDVDARLDGGPWEIKCGKKRFTVRGCRTVKTITKLEGPS